MSWFQVASAISDNNLALLRATIDGGFTVDSELDDWATTALHMASQLGRQDIVSFDCPYPPWNDTLLCARWRTW
jgi:hypothetical protein